jgi:hypothetical protein
MADIDISTNDALKALVLTSMMQVLDAKTKETMIRTALETLVTPPKSNTYGYTPKSPLQDAFDCSLNAMAREVVKEMLETMEAKQRVRDVCARAFEKMVVEGDRLAEAMASALSSAMTRDR